MFNLTQQQLAHFQAFGFVVLPGLLDRQEVATLTAEVTGALSDAFGGIGTTDRSELGGSSGDYLPLSVDRAPWSQALIADDPRLFQSSAALLGRPTVPTVPIATCLTANAAWHTDQGPDVGEATLDEPCGSRLQPCPGGDQRDRRGLLRGRARLTTMHAWHLLAGGRGKPLQIRGVPDEVLATLKAKAERSHPTSSPAEQELGHAAPVQDLCRPRRAAPPRALRPAPGGP